jgi:Tol biopolymer transport system component
VLYLHSFSDVVLRDRWSGTSELVNVPYAGGEPDGSSKNEALSGDARYVTYSSAATNLVPGDSNGAVDVFLRDRQAGTTERISVDSRGAQANGASYGSVVSDDGRFVAFFSEATNLAPADAGLPPLFIRDRLLRTTRRLVRRAQWPLTAATAVEESHYLSMSTTGRYIAFQATGPAPLSEENVFLHDRLANTTQRISVVANGDPLAPSGGGVWPSISANGRYVAFASTGNRFGPADVDTDMDVYVRDLESGITTRESYGSAPWVRGQAFSPSLSANGRFVSFHSLSFNLVAGQIDNNGKADIYTRDRLTGAIECDSRAYDGTAADSYSIFPAISRGGRWVVFLSPAQNLVPDHDNIIRDVFIHDRGPLPPP